MDDRQEGRRGNKNDFSREYQYNKNAFSMEYQYSKNEPGQ